MSDTATQRTPGRVGPHRESHESSLEIGKFMAPAPSAYKDWDGTHGITLWGTNPENAVDWNDNQGDCGAAAVDHGNAAKANNVSLVGTLGQPTYPDTVHTYWAYGVAMGEPGPQPDQGVDNATWLGFLYKAGIIGGYAEVLLNQLDAYAPEFNGLLLGLQLYDSAQPDFTNHIPWGSGPEQPDPRMGHDTWLIQLAASGGGGLITWGYNQLFTPSFRQNNLTDAWAVYDKDDPRAQDPALQAALGALHGTQAGGTTP